jgi:signal transduction histidine kinase
MKIVDMTAMRDSSTDVTGADVTRVANISVVPTILDVVCQTTGMGFAAVARVTKDRWIACGVRDDIAFGLKPGGELKIESTICNEIRDSRQAVIIDHVASDPVFHQHHTPAQYGFQSYISMPIMLGDGSFFGTLCAIDPRPMRLNTPQTIGMFKLFAELIAFHLDAHQRLTTSEAELNTERQDAELREQFIAVLGHDLRNPLASISAGTQVLLRTSLDEKAKSVVGLIQNSVNRMSGLIENILDFARGRLGEGLQLEYGGDEMLTPMLQQVVEELRISHPDRLIEADFARIPRLACDRIRLGQLLSNLVANALTHGAKEGPVRVATAYADGIFELSVANHGEPIPAEMIKDLFKPFFRATGRPGLQGLGLGLYIAAEIARAHRGTLKVTSSSVETRFTFSMPVT